MERQKYSGRDARRVLVGMVTDRTVCARIASQWNSDGLFASRWENMVATWCIRHLAKYGFPIGRQIESVFEEWAEKRQDEKTVQLAEKFLVALSDEYEQESPLASDYVLDLAGRHFNEVRKRQLVQALEMDLDEGRLDEADGRIANFRKVDLGVGAVVTPTTDFDAWVDAFDAERTPALVEFPDPLGEFVGAEFGRDAFVSFTGAFSRGKSWWLLEIAFRAVKQKRRVLMFEVGDMTRSQIMARMGQRAARRPKTDQIVNYPVRFDEVEEGPIIKKRKLKGLGPRDAYKAWRRIDPMGRFRLSCHSSGSVSAEKILGQVREGERAGWVPDVVVIDYADLLAPPPGIENKRDQIDETWKQLRRLSQDVHCLVVTATQGDANSYGQNLIRGKNFSDSRTKNDHITAGFGINVNDKDKSMGVFRLNWLKRRDAAFSENWQISVAGCLAIGCPLIRSCK